MLRRIKKVSTFGVTPLQTPSMFLQPVFGFCAPEKTKTFKNFSNNERRAPDADIDDYRYDSPSSEHKAIRSTSKLTNKNQIEEVFKGIGSQDKRTILDFDATEKMKASEKKHKELSTNFKKGFFTQMFAKNPNVRSVPFILTENATLASLRVK